MVVAWVLKIKKNKIKQNIEYTLQIPDGNNIEPPYTTKSQSCANNRLICIFFLMMAAFIYDISYQVPIWYNILSCLCIHVIYDTMISIYVSVRCGT